MENKDTLFSFGMELHNVGFVYMRYGVTFGLGKYNQIYKHIEENMEENNAS